ncbi:MAG: AsmA family protein [Candidatus Rokubacteria bacterium]|nr:AsmA family protein [Candidatus Rokubacteria bacterium]
MRTRRLTLLFTGLGIGLVLLAGALLLSLPFLVDLPRIQALLRAEASRLLDRPVRFERVSVGLWPLPAIRVRGLSVANGPGFGPDPLLTVEDARVRVRLLPLLQGRLSFGEVTLARPRVVLEQRRDGAWNLPRPAAVRPAPAAPFVLISRVRLEGGRVEIRLQGEAEDAAAAHLVDGIDVTLADLGWIQPIRFKLAARLPGGGLVLAVEGQIGPLAAAGADLAALPARFTARFTAEESRPAAGSGFALTGRGEGEVHAEGLLGNMLGGGRLALTRLTVAHSPPGCGRSREPHRLVVESVELPVQIAGARVTVEPFALRVAGGSVRGGAVLSWRAGVPSVRLADLRVQGVAAEAVLVDFLCQPYAVTGRLDGAGDVAFSGTGSDLLRSARGSWQVQVGPGRLVGPAVLTLLAGAVRVGSVLSSVVNVDAATSLLASPLEFQALSAAGSVGAGQLRVRQLDMQSRLLRLSGSGTYGLLDTRLDFDLDVQTGRSAFGVKLAGTAREPSYRPVSRGLFRGLGKALNAALSPPRKAPWGAAPPGSPSPERR